MLVFQWFLMLESMSSGTTRIHMFMICMLYAIIQAACWEATTLPA
jgi:hypothetical protein